MRTKQIVKQMTKKKNQIQNDDDTEYLNVIIQVDCDIAKIS